MPSTRYPEQSQRKQRVIRLTIAFVFFLLASLLLLVGVLAKRSDFPIISTASSSIHTMPQNSSTPDSQPSTRGGLPYPDNLPHQSSQAFAPQATEASQFYINFDNVLGGTIVTDQYLPAVFSTDAGHYTFARGDDYWGSSFPNNLDRGPFGFPVDTSGYAPLYVNFTTPVNNLRFYLLAVDELRSGIAQLKIYRDGSSTPSATRNLDGRGTVFAPLLVDVGGPSSAGGMGYDRVTRIEIVNITDYQGVAFDDFSFTIAPGPSPTPTPSPSPTPFPPTNLIGEADKIKVSLAWDNSGATTYNVKRRSSTTEWARIATGLQTTRFDDSSVIPDTLYFYAVSAVNGNGESADSNLVSATLVASCGDHVEARPTPEQYPDRGNGWSMNAQVTDRDGLVLTDVSLNGRYMAEMMSVPYFSLKTNKMPVAQRGELTPDSALSTMRVRLLRYRRPTWFDSQGVSIFGIVADYAVDRITPTSKSCLLITQNYEFHDKGVGCEPSDTLPCSLFYPQVSYRFEGRDGEVLESMNVAQRMHYRVEGIADNTIGLLRDCDVPLLGCALPGESFDNEENPVVKERLYHVIQHGKDSRTWDNLHQTRFDLVEKPGLSSLKVAGCSECVHTHWRWAWIFGDQYGSGLPIIGYNSNRLPDQDVDIGVVRYRLGEEHPNPSFTSLINETELVRNPVVRITSPVSPPTPRFPSRRITVLRPADVVFWYSATSHEPISDLFFKHGSFFNPDPHPNMTAANATGSAANSIEAVQDGIRSINYGHVYKEGSTTFSNVDPNTLAPLPAGYVPLDNRVYKIDTDGAVSGPHVVSFDVPSINDQAVFNDLAIFHLEQDPFDPDNFVWVDDTILSPDTPASDFNTKIVNGRVEDIGYFAIGSLTQPQVDPGSSDLSVTVNASPEPAVVENNLTYTLHLTNNGPQPATGVGIVDAVPTEVAFVSATSTQGTCKFSNGSVYCKVGTLANGASCDVTIVVSPREDKTGVPPQGESIVNVTAVGADNDDSNVDNNSATQTTTLLPNPNSRPSVSITAPITGATYVGPANVTITATATDSDGSISQVDFYDGGTLIGTATPAGVANQYQRSLNPSFGSHTYFAVATDNGGRTNVSDSVNIFVNGAGSISITSPTAGSVFDPSASLTVTANATNPSGPISKVEFFANSIPLGEGILVGANQYSITWNNAPVGFFTLRAVLTDSFGVITNSPPVTVTITTKPSVTILSPTDGMSFPLLSKVVIMATAQDSDGIISKVDFYANGSLVGSGSSIGQDRFAVDWMQVPTGVYSLTAAATDNLGVSTTSPAITIGVNTPSPQAGEFVWFDDALPPGALNHTDDEGWFWVDANPGAFSGAKAHQSRNFAQLDLPNNSLHQHYFEGATTTLPVNAGDKLFTYVFLDVNSMPREIMLQWKDADGWEHRAYWGANRINWGVDGTNSRRFMGPLPKAGQWVRLEVPADLVGLEGSTLNGMAFALDAGRATFDLAGKATANAAPPPVTPLGDSVWIEDGLPAGAIPAGVNQTWNWVVGPVYFGQIAHQSNGGEKYQSHSFTGAQTPISVNPGDVLFTYVYLGDPDLTRDPKTPDEIMLQWYDGISWEHRAFWGENFIGQQFRSLGVQGTESQRFIGGLPAIRGWYRLEVPASYVGLEGKTVNGMAFSVYRDKNDPFVTWDRSGKSPQLSSAPLPLSATSGVWRLFSNTYGYAFETNDQGPPDHFPQKKDVFFVHPNQAPGTVPFYRFRRPNLATPEYFYSRCKECYDGNGWTFDGIAFYVFTDAATPGAVPLYLYQDSHSHYLLTTDLNEVTGASAIWAYTYATNPIAPANAAPVINLTSPTIGALFTAPATVSINASASDSDGSISKVEFFQGSTKLGEASAAPYNFEWNNVASGNYSLTAVATDNLGSGAVSNAVNITVNAPPIVSITSPATGTNFPANAPITINASASDSDGTIAKVEFFASANKLGEVTTGPYSFTWNNASTGTYSVTTRATDNLGATSSSAPVSITVGKSDQTIAFDLIADKTYEDTPFSINASSSSGLPVSFIVISNVATVSANMVTITGAGSVSIRADQAGNDSFNPAPAVTRSFNVAKASATITLSNLSQTYDGAPKAATATTNPAGLSGVTVTYNGSTTAPTSAGNYSVVASLTNNNYTTTAGNATGTLSIAKASATITLGNLSQTYDGTPRAATATTNPAGLTGVAITYNGAATAPTNAGSHSVVASLTNDNYTATAGNATGTLVIGKAVPTISWSDPSGINYGTALSSAQLNPTASFLGSNLPGSFAYTPPAGTVLNPGNGQLISTTFTPTDSVNFNTATGSVHINVNGLPSVSISSPTAGAVFSAPASLSINASAADSDGTISKVEFFQGGALLGTDTTSPYNFTWSNVAVGNYALTARATDNLGATTTTSTVSVSVVQPINSGKIAFASNRDGVAQIYLMNQDGSNLIRLTNNAANNECPRWSPNNSRIVFQSDRDNVFSGSADIYVMNADGSGQTRLTSDVFDDSTPVWSPDGTKIAFQSIRNGVNYQVYVMNADGSGQVNISNSAVNDIQPSWSPDGTKIAFASDRDHAGFSSIYVMNANGSNQTRLTFSGSGFRDEQPAWSPDGMKLAFTSTRDSVVETWQETDDDGGILTRTATRINKEVYVMNADGSSALRLTNTLENDDSPAWSGDGTKIVYRSDRERECCDPFEQIWIMNADGTNQVDLSNNGLGDYCPSWSR